MRGPVEDAPGPLGSDLVALHRELAVHDHVAEAYGVLVRLVVDGTVGDGRGIEDDDVGLHAGAEQAPLSRRSMAVSAAFSKLGSAPRARVISARFLPASLGSNPQLTI